MSPFFCPPLSLVTVPPPAPARSVTNRPDVVTRPAQPGAAAVTIGTLRSPPCVVTNASNLVDLFVTNAGTSADLDSSTHVGQDNFSAAPILKRYQDV